MNLKGFKFNFIDFFWEQRKHLIILCCIFFVGFLTGIITFAQLSKIFEVEQLSDIILRDSITGHVGFFSYLFRRFFECVIVMCFCFLISLNFYSCFINYVVVFYKAYVVGCTLSMCVALLGLGGFINIIIFYFPFQLIINFVLICYLCICFRLSYNKHCYGKCYRIDFNFLWIFLILIFAVCFIEALFLPTLLKSIIFVA